ncbi:DNA primase [Ancylobacter novellus DSM 506]|uniref:DNA primase n=1 Tax=Ancylobacter novellus (strain ATCC 8093 / DSM 506 / JCM 20403 / CCM 1077 / IAM 12100 / NBRC 12443 / NCIMB 10456) TaxID=639283 RepID=D7A2I2_ANCN5|nr:DNA primase [Ancylobacter novellus]ADH89645.1 DNA primase [Ancylobacter novellus DSM 506]
MRFPPSFLDEIRARLPVSEVVGKRVQLKKQGREWRGLSPFNPEKTPSFYVNDQKGFYHCFSSGKHGDQFDFLMEVEGLPFPEAVERLASMAGLPMPVQSREEEQRESRRKTLHEVMELAAKYYEAVLQSRAGAKGRGYLADRGLGPSTQGRFRLGYSLPDRFALKEALGGKGIPVEDMVEAGLLITAEDVAIPYDRFRDRVMFPITDLRGRVVAFGGRALEKDVPAKYLNSPETSLFHKGSLLYNGFSARAAAHNGAPVIAVEGYVDVIALVEAGFSGAVAPLGTALTEEQLALLWKMAAEPVLLFDGDKAGRRAAYRAIDLALPHLKPGVSLSFGTLPDGQDPDDLVRAGGREAVDAVLAQARPLADVLWSREMESASVDTPERRAALEARIGEVVRVIADETVRKHYRSELMDRFRRLFTPVAVQGEGSRRGSGDYQGRFDRSSGRGGRRPNDRRPVSGVAGEGMRRSALVRGAAAEIPRNEALLLFAAINHPWLLDQCAEELADLPFQNKEAAELRRALLDAHMDGDDADHERLAARLESQGHAPLVARLARAAIARHDWPAFADAARSDVELWWHQRLVLHRRGHALSKDLKEAEKRLAEEPTDMNWARFLDVQRQLAALDGTEALVEGFGAASGRPARSM